MKNKPIYTILIICLLFLAGCDDGTKQQLADLQVTNENLINEIETLKKNISEVSRDNSALNEKIVVLETENIRLSNTPARQLSKINAFIEDKNEAKAISVIAELKKDFPKAAELEQAEKLLTDMQTQIKETREAAERKERLGFKVLKDISKFQVPGLKISVSQPKITGRWVSDSYGDSYHYKDAKRGNRFITARVSITADKNIKNPKLPGFGVYEVSGKKLKLIASADYEFVRWKDYGSYLGNYPDYRNDFAYTATIPFTIGAEVPNEKLQQPMYLIAARSNCHKRMSRRLGPALMYLNLCNSNIIKSLSINDATSENYFIIKSWNSNKI